VILDLTMLTGGGLLLYFGAEWLVAGAAGLARALGVSALTIGLTVVAYGTSTPEVIVGVQAAAGGHPELALGNVLGSNIANLGLILGVTALIRPARIDAALPRRELPLLALSALAVPVLLLDGAVQQWEGATLLLVAALYTVWLVRSSRSPGETAAAANVTAEAADVAGAPTPRGGRARLVGIAVIGLLLLVVGGQLLVEGAVGVARAIGMSERVVGLTIVAIGTSLPELVTSVIASVRGHTDIAVGNVVGSNIFNILLCLGSASVVGRVGSPLASVALDVGAMIAFSLVGAAMMLTARTVTRIEGTLLVVSYAVFLGLLVGW
jgi:cation:H+ antiporter